MATLHACRRFATPNLLLTPEPQIEIWGYRLSSLRDSKTRQQTAGFGEQDWVSGAGFRVQEAGLTLAPSA